MQFSPVQQFIQFSSISDKNNYQSKVSASSNFASTLNNVVSRELTIQVQGNEGTSLTAFRKQKELIEDGSEMVPEDEENESIYKTIKKIESRIIKLARLERQMMAGF